jgi:hypothetical protein
VRFRQVHSSSACETSCCLVFPRLSRKMKSIESAACDLHRNKCVILKSFQRYLIRQVWRLRSNSFCEIPPFPTVGKRHRSNSSLLRDF